MDIFLRKKVIVMFSYIQILDKDASIFKGCVDYEFSDDALSITMVRGAKTLHRIKIPLDEITDLFINGYYGSEEISFIYQSQKYRFFNTGYGESSYFKNRISKMVTA